MYLIDNHDAHFLTLRAFLKYSILIFCCGDDAEGPEDKDRKEQDVRRSVPKIMFYSGKNDAGASMLPYHFRLKSASTPEPAMIRPAILFTHCSS